MDWAGDWLDRLHQQPAPARPISAVSRGDAETAPASGLLFTEQVGWPAGERPLALAWRGGRAPFMVAVTAAGGGEPLLRESGIQSRAHQTAPLDLAPGGYLLGITDADGRALRTRLLVGPAAEVPKPPADAIPPGLPADVRATLAAAWLASQAGGWPWRLAAYQHVAGLDGYAPAALLRRALVEDAELPAAPAAPRTP
jgi:hypothetical protein